MKKKIHSICNLGFIILRKYKDKAKNLDRKLQQQKLVIMHQYSMQDEIEISDYEPTFSNTSASQGPSEYSLVELLTPSLPYPSSPLHLSSLEKYLPLLQENCIHSPISSSQSSSQLCIKMILNN